MKGKLQHTFSTFRNANLSKNNQMESENNFDENGSTLPILRRLELKQFFFFFFCVILGVKNAILEIYNVLYSK